MDGFTPHLSGHDFKTLFVERLGWDHANGTVTAEVDGLAYRYEVIAHKRGFKVIHCEADRYTLFNRRRLRALQKQLLKVAHEHIVIYSCGQPRKQVWQWAVHMPDGRRLRHREHPFFSTSPSGSLVERLKGLRFTLAEEDRVTLVDALNRVRTALDTRAELDLFVNRPWYAEQSDRLAIAMREGDLPAFHAFVLFHRPLAKWGARRLQRWFGMDEEDAEQTGMIAVLRAAKLFKPELGYQFSTYATRAIHQKCHRFGPDKALLIRVPAAVYWPYMRIRRTSERLDARSGLGTGSRFLCWMARRDDSFGRRWTRFRAATELLSLSDRREPEYEAARLLQAADPNPATALVSATTAEFVASALDSLPPDDGCIIRLRYGLDGEPQTLEAIGALFGVTKERIRQRQVKSEAALRATILKMLGEPADAAPENAASTAQSDVGAPQSEGGSTDPPTRQQSNAVVQGPPEEPPELFAQEYVCSPPRDRH